MNAYYYLPMYILFYIFFLKIHMEISRIIEVFNKCPHLSTAVVQFCKSKCYLVKFMNFFLVMQPEILQPSHTERERILKTCVVGSFLQAWLTVWHESAFLFGKFEKVFSFHVRISSFNIPIWYIFIIQGFFVYFLLKA